ncbi:uncharacterized protein LOC111340569 isoform X2 [Stylophora pistillata]|uniref:uncharacterized protein LOC111340569 isoform X2 n=1 Tax=Stylophora pistillata TaxID=50429 RepID=UPI000C048388|nr:uncharacterized protein LOC111340569 isoform X2 [Stylophora pistillata]
MKISAVFIAKMSTTSKSEIVLRRGRVTEDPMLLSYLLAANYMRTSPPVSKEDRFSKEDHFSKEDLMPMRVVSTRYNEGSLIAIARCRSLESLDALWDGYRIGLLNEMAQKYLVTEEILMEFGLTEMILKIAISEEEYRADRDYFVCGHSECFLPRVVSQGPFGLESESDPMECESQAETDSKLEDLQQQEEMKIGPNALSQNMLQSTSNESESCLVDKSGSLWKLQEIQAAACIAFAPNAVPTAILFKCTLLGSTMELLPLAKNEELVSDVIQLSYSELSGTSFTGEFDETVTVALSHSAAKLEGYEVVISELVDSTKREWKDLETTNVWENSDVEENLLSRLRVPYAEARVTRCSTYAVLYRLKSHTYLIDHSRNQKFTCRIPEYPDVQVTIPAEIVTKGNLQLTLKVQEIPQEWLEESGVLAGPVLHITCSSAIQLLEPAEITLPMSLSANEEQYVDFSTCDIVVSANSDDGTTGWKDITKELPRPAELNDRVVTFQVRHFTRFLVSRKERKRLRRQSRLYHHADSKPRTAGFAACLCRVDEFSRNSQLRFCCYPSHLEKRVRQEWFSTYSVSLYGCGSSNEKLCDDERITARPYRGLKLRKETLADELILRFNRSEKYESEVIVQRNRGDVQVKFFNEDGSKCLRNMTIVTPQKTQVLQDARGTSEAGDSSENMKISSSHGGPTPKRPKKIKDGVKKGCPSLEELLDLSQKLVKWKPLGRYLLDMDESTITQIHKENEELEEKAYQMLRHWKQKKHKKATYHALFSALCRIDRKDLAEEFCRAGTSTF